MLTAAATACLRSGRTISAAGVASAASVWTKRPCPGASVWGTHVSLRGGSRPLTGPPGGSRLLTDPPGDSTAPPGGGLSDPREQEDFGSIAGDMSSRRLFRKTSPHLHDLRHREQEEGEPGTPPGRPARRNTAYWYFLQTKRLIRDNKLQDALDMFSRDMLQQERLQPEEFNYSVLIGGCGRAGRLKLAFRLYNDLKKRGLEATDATYTALFNACAEAEHKQAGLQRALELEQELRRRNFPLSTITYHALLKTHALANGLQACVHTLREMLQNGHVVTEKTFHFLLMACVNDKDEGFRLALQVWRQMLKAGILPDAKNYNLLLRAARDCGIGDAATASRLLLGPAGASEGGARAHAGSRTAMDVDLLERELFLRAEPLRQGRRGGEEEEPPSPEDATQLVPIRRSAPAPVRLAADGAAPNLLDMFEGEAGGVVSLGPAHGAADRLALVGGAKGFLDKMESGGLSPDLQTLTLLAGTMEPGHASLQALLKVAKKHKIKLDVAFFNCAIHAAARGGDPEGAKAVLSVMQQRNVSVNVQTFGCLALSCERQHDALQLLEDMEAAGLKPNVRVFSALIGRAAKRLDYVYLKTMLKTMKSLGVWPNELVIQKLELAAKYPLKYNQYKSRNNYLVHVDGFRGYYQQWLKEMPALSKEDEQLQQQAEASSALRKSEAAGGLSDSHRAAARRFKSKKSRARLSEHS